MLVVKLKPWTDHGDTGELWLEFVNNRLEATRFFPATFHAYLADLRGAGIQAPNNDEERVAGKITSPPRTVLEAVPDADPPFVWWYDKALFLEDIAWGAHCDSSN